MEGFSIWGFTGASGRLPLTEEGLPLLTEDDDFKTDIITMSHFGILFDRYLSRRDTDMVTDTIGDVLSTYDKKTLSNEIWHLSDFYGRNNF
jgi:hypothetical protein